MIENAQPIIYGTLGISGVEIVSSNTFNDTLSIILQLIISAGTLYKLYIDRNQRRKNKTEI
jgi:hypothetical protein